MRPSHYPFLTVLPEREAVPTRKAALADRATRLGFRSVPTERTDQMVGQGDNRSSNDRDRSLRTAIGAVATLAFAGLAVWAFAPGLDGERSNDPADPFDGARRVSLEAAGEMARSTGHPVFWAGRIPGMEVAMSHDSRMNVHVRYLPEGVDPETERDAFFTIGSYPYGRAFEATARLAGEPGRTEIDLRHGVGFIDRLGGDRLVFVLKSHPDLQIEIDHPRPDQALEALRQGTIVPIE
jgi:hypothetical protein